jgi:ferredoxin-type protein NapH
MKIKITTIRTITQVFFFVFLIFGGFYITATHIDSSLGVPFIKAPANRVKPDNLEPNTQYDQVFDLYFPSRTCRYLESDVRVFRGCSMHFLTEVPIYGVPLYDFLPHVIFFVILAFLFSRFLCGWVCPLGAFQDFLAWIRKKLGLSHFKLPRLFYNFFEKFSYVWLVFLFIMAVAIIIPALGLIPFQRDLNLISCNTCPARILFPIMTGGSPGWYLFHNPLSTIISIVAIIFLVIFLLSFFGKRLWCRICPTGALLSLFNKGGAIVKEKNPEKCTKCGVCERVCPMDNRKVYEEKNKKIVNSHNCINCFRCVDECPEEDCLKVNFLGKKIFRSKRK